MPLTTQPTFEEWDDHRDRMRFRRQSKRYHENSATNLPGLMRIEYELTVDHVIPIRNLF